MSSEPRRYLVIVEKFAEGHFLNEFRKRHGWEVTWRGIEQMLMRFNVEALGSRLSSPLHVSEGGEQVVYKMSFSVAGEGKSPKSSGNRMIIFCDDSSSSIRILMVYHKRNIKGSKETAWIDSTIDREFGDLFS